jgi:hypothetical protein
VKVGIYFPLLEQRLELGRHLGQRLAGTWIAPVAQSQDHVDLAPRVVGVGMVVARVAAAALLALERGHRRALGHGEQRVRSSAVCQPGL